MSRLDVRLREYILHAQRLFHMLVGLVFLFLAVAGVSVSLHLWRDYRRSPVEGLAGFEMVAGFTILLIIFSLYSFLKARSVR